MSSLLMTARSKVFKAIKLGGEERQLRALLIAVRNINSQMDRAGRGNVVSTAGQRKVRQLLKSAGARILLGSVHREELRFFRVIQIGLANVQTANYDEGKRQLRVGFQHMQSLIEKVLARRY